MLQCLAMCLFVAGVAPPAHAATGAPASLAPQVKPKGSPQAPAAGADADAYYQFLLGRHYESNGDIDNAIKAFKRAAQADPKSAEIPAELAALYARQDDAPRAIATAEAALKLDADNVEAHRVLGMVYAALARPDEPSHTTDPGFSANAAEAIKHLEAALRAPDRLPDSGLQLLLGRLYVATRQFSKAIPVLEEFLGREGDYPEGVELLADAYASANRLRDASALLARAALTDPQFYVPLAESYEREQRWKDAASAYEQALKARPSSAELKTRLAVALLSTSGAQEAGRARDLLAQVIKDRPTDARVLYLMAQAQRATKDYDGAEQTARRLMALAPASAAGPEVLAQVYTDGGEPDKVIALLQPLVMPGQPGAKVFPANESSSLLVSLGFAYQDRGEMDHAVAAFEEARKQSPANPTYGIYFAQAQLAAGHVQAALDLVRELRPSAGNDMRLARVEAEALRRSGKVDQGADVLKGAIAARPADSTGYLLLAEFYMDAQRYDEALSLLRDAGRKFPDDLSILFQEGAALERARRYGEAEAAFRGVIARDPLHALALNYLGYMMADRGENLDEAIGYIKRALAIEPANPSYLDSLGWAYYKQNKLDLAETNLRAAADSRARDSAIQDHYGDLLEKRGRYAEAVAAWNRALAGDGGQVDRPAIERKIKAAQGKIKPR